jgi:hypothetical protein
MSKTGHLFRTVAIEEAVARVSFLLGANVDCCEVSLIDPTCGQRIVVPGRGILCDHIDVVDVHASVDPDSSLQSDQNTLDPSWVCPVCGGEYDTKDGIEVDGFFESILSEIQPSENSVVVYADGRWTAPAKIADVPDFNPHKRKERILPDRSFENELVELLSSSSDEDSPQAKRTAVVELSSDDD